MRRNPVPAAAIAAAGRPPPDWPRAWRAVHIAAPAPTPRVHPAQRRVASKPARPVVLQGYAACLGLAVALDDGTTGFLAPGCFDRTVARRAGVPFLSNHDPERVIAPAASGALQLAADEHGLAFRLHVPDTTEGRLLVAGVRAGRYGGVSIAFRPVRKDAQIMNGWQRFAWIRDMWIDEISVVGWPRQSATVVFEGSAADHDEPLATSVRSGRFRHEAARAWLGQLRNRAARPALKHCVVRAPRCSRTPF